MSEEAIINYASDIVVRVRHNAAVRVEMSEQGPQGPAGDITPAMMQTLADTIEAKAGAETAASNAAAAQQGAVLARTGAETAKTGAETAKADANAERQAAEIARQAAETARGGAETARTGAQTARTGAEMAKDSAEAALLSGQGVLGQTQTARDLAIGARDAAQAARTGAETARGGAEAAESATAALRNEVVDALIETESARDQAFGARDAAQTAAQSTIDTAAISLTIQPAPATNTNLNAVTAKGIYLFTVPGAVTIELNFPVAGRTGRLVVLKSGTKVIQEYTDDQVANGWLRVSTDNGGSWTAWAAIWNSTTMPVVSQAEAEAGSAANPRAWSAQRVRQNVADYASPLGHTHVAADITDLQALLDAKSNVGDKHPISDVTGLQAALDTKAPLASPALTGTPTAPTASTGTRSTQIATTAFVGAELNALVGAAPGLLDTLAEIADSLGDDPNFAATMTAQLAGKAPLVHVHPVSDVTGLQDALDLKAPLASPALTGNPTAPNQAPGTSDTRIANTAFVAAMGATKAAIDHVHDLNEMTNVNLEGAADGNFLKRASGIWVPSQILITDVQELEAALAELEDGIEALNNNAILIDGTAAKLPVGPTSTRPEEPSAGYIRYNSTTGKFEGYGVAWGNIGGGAYIGTTAPNNPGHGDIWLHETLGVLLVYYDNGTSAQWISATPTVDPSLFLLKGDALAGVNPAAARATLQLDRFNRARNRLINGSFWVNQRAVSYADYSSGSPSGYPVDRWFTVVSSGTLRAQQLVTPTPNGAPCRLKFTVQTAATPAGTDNHVVIQYVEGTNIADAMLGTANAKNLIYRIGIKSSMAGTFGVTFRNEAANRSFVSSVTISAGEVGNDVVKTIIVPGDTVGTWQRGSGVGVGVIFCLGVGTTYAGTPGWQSANYVGLTGQTNFMGTVGATIELFDAGLYVDHAGHGIVPPYEPASFAEELRACQRYYQPVRVIHDWYAAQNGLIDRRNWLLPVAMRTTPSRTADLVNYNNASSVNVSVTSDSLQHEVSAGVAGYVGSSFIHYLSAEF